MSVGLFANEAEETAFCGEQVLLTATPDAGYHFVQWSDGVTDNPRLIEIDESGGIEVEAEFERDCYEPDIPVVHLYDWVLMLNVDSLHNAGWQFGETDVRWYRVVDDADDVERILDDEWQATGYYLSIDAPLTGTGDYYAALAVSGPKDIQLCSNIVRSEIVSYSPAESGAGRQIALMPTYLRVGETLRLTGLNAAEATEVYVYDPAGRLLHDYRLQGEAHFMLRAEDTDGIYLVRVKNGDKQCVFKYVAIR